MDPGAAATRILRRTGFGVSVIWSALFALFLGGETMLDPGGWLGVALVLSWAAPLAFLMLFARRRTDRATQLFAGLAGTVVALDVWCVADPAGWRSFENGHGPLRAIAVFVVGSALAVHGLRRTASAGFLLLLIGAISIALSHTRGGGFSSLMAAAIPPTITGLLYVASGLWPGTRRP